MGLKQKIIDLVKNGFVISHAYQDSEGNGNNLMVGISTLGKPMVGVTTKTSYIKKPIDEIGNAVDVFISDACSEENRAYKLKESYILASEVRTLDEDLSDVAKRIQKQLISGVVEKKNLVKELKEGKWLESSTDGDNIYNCVISINNENETAFLLKETPLNEDHPSLFEIGFETDLHDCLNDMEKATFPPINGIYECKVSLTSEPHEIVAEFSNFKLVYKM